MKNMLKQILITEELNEEPPSEDKPPSKMRDFEESSVHSGLSLVSIGRRWTILSRSTGSDSKFVVIPSVGNMFCR